MFKFSRRITPVMASVLLFASTACTMGKPVENDPKQRLKDYISASFNVSDVEGRKTLESFLTGEAKSRLAAWSNEQFIKAFVDSKRQFVKLVFREDKSISPQETHIVYELTYLDAGRGADAKVTNKKLSHLVLDKDKWLIREVRNIKELVEYQNEMSLP
jgi:hypothetical protein